MTETPVLGLIPARGGSKGLKGKNLLPLAGRPLIAHTIAAALASRAITRVVVTTDDPAIAAAARQAGAEVPFLRPAELAADATPALPVIRHALDWLDRAGWPAAAVAYLQPTSPLRRAEHIDAAVDLLFSEKADSVVSVVEVPHNFNPVSVLRLTDGVLRPFLAQNTDPLRRQDKPRVLARNGPAVLAATRATILELGVLYGPRTLPLLMTPQDSVDVDDAFDLELCEWLLARREKEGR
ncbi:MAG: acylneuraminate cytidylyltransferase family protein [Pseudomonadota bacterium]